MRKENLINRKIENEEPGIAALMLDVILTSTGMHGVLSRDDSKNHFCVRQGSEFAKVFDDNIDW